MKLYVVGFGSGSRECMTSAAEKAILDSEIIMGYNTYIEIIKNFFPDKHYISSGMREEAVRAENALHQAETHNTALVCSGDPELYGMAGLVYELSGKYPSAEIEIVPGVSAAFSGGALLGSPLTEDFAVISLSDLITPSERIEKRLRCAAEADFTIVLYNPASKKRREHLKKACDIILEYRSAETVCGYAANIGRTGEKYGVMTLAEMRDLEADMFTTIFIGNSAAKKIGGKMVVPRGYKIDSENI